MYAVNAGIAHLACLLFTLQLRPGSVGCLRMGSARASASCQSLARTRVSDDQILVVVDAGDVNASASLCTLVFGGDEAAG
jgi:hypothetical protein